MVDRDTPLVVSRRLARGPSANGRFAVVHMTLGTQFDMDDKLWELVEGFREPKTLQQVLAATPAPAVESMRMVLDAFVAAGILVPENEDAYVFEHGAEIAAAGTPLLNPPERPGLLGAIHHRVDSDVCFFGVAFDRTSPQGGSSEGPAALRELSSKLPLFADPATGAHQGLRDGLTGRLFLAGTTISDMGDIDLPAWESHQETFDRIARLATLAAGRTDGLPIFVGGDHSITEPLVRGLVREPVVVVQLDAHSDLFPTVDGVAHHHASVMDRVRRLDVVRRVVQVGVREWSPSWYEPPSSVVQVPPAKLRELTPAGVVRLLPPDLPVYLTIDIDVLDPSVARGTSTPMPGGPDLETVEELVEAIAGSTRLVGADLVELAPHRDPGGVTPLVAFRLLVRLIEGARKRRR